ncbi:MAG: L,D-transpeptidase family protein [Flavipsychrobacter sp.]|nr:L,D-transpeptidase family protein [Flavipsychrobacter sp.]
MKLFEMNALYRACSILLCCILLSGWAKGNVDKKLVYPELVETFYHKAGAPLFWFNGSLSLELRSSFKQLLDSCEYSGLNKMRYHYLEIVTLSAPSDSSSLRQLDRLYTDAAITYFKDMYQGYGISGLLSYDEISAKCIQADNTYLLDKISQVSIGKDIAAAASSLEPNMPLYGLLKTELRKQLLQGDQKKIQQLQQALNLHRWIFHFGFKKMIVVNIPATMLKYYEDNTLQLDMKVVVGKPLTRTPRFSAYCNQVIFYPFWHVPAKIARNEMLPMIKRNPAVLDKLDIQVINASGTVVNPHSINWKKLNCSNFNYTLRQSTGCDNSLGVIKFNLTDPYSVYLHDTNFKIAFSSNRRFYSHGCIRIEKPLELAGFLLPEKVDTTFLKACIKDHTPVINPIREPVPIFVVYMTADVDSSNTIKYYPDVYHLLD